MLQDYVRFWCHHVIPLVYDDSLSYYELLCKVTGKINEIISIINDVPTVVKDEFEEMKNNGELEEIISEVMAEGFPKYNATYHVQIYVNDSYGNDDNDGLTSDKPVKTIKKALDIMARKSDGVYINIMSSGNYTISYPVISGCMIHMNVYAPNVTIYWLDPDDTGWTKAFYNCYIHLGGYEDGTTRFHVRGTRDAYLESGKIFARNIKFSADNGIDIGVVGGAFQFQTCTFECPVYLSSAVGAFGDCTFDMNDLNISYTAILHAYNGASVTIRGATALKLTSYITNIISGTSATFFFNTTPSFLSETSDEDKTSYLTNCIVVATQARANAWLRAATISNCVINGVDYNGEMQYYSDRLTSWRQIERGNRLRVPPNAKYADICLVWLGLSGTTPSSYNYSRIPVGHHDTLTIKTPVFYRRAADTDNKSLLLEAGIDHYYDETDGEEIAYGSNHIYNLSDNANTNNSDQILIYARYVY